MPLRSLFILGCFAGTLPALTPPPEYVGHWKGDARIGVTGKPQGYRLKADVTGDLIADEKVHRDGAYVFLHKCEDGVTSASVNSYGNEGFPGATARQFRLEKQK